MAVTLQGLFSAYPQVIIYISARPLLFLMVIVVIFYGVLDTQLVLGNVYCMENMERVSWKFSVQ